MILSNRQVEHQKKTMENLAKIRLGDTVKVVDCFEAVMYAGETFKVISEPRQIGCTWSVKIERHGYYDIACLEKCEVSE